MTQENSLRIQLCDGNLKIDVSLEYEEISMDQRGHGRLYEGYTANATGEVDMQVGGNKMN